MATMNVSLPDALRDWVQAQIAQGKYSSQSDYVRDLIRRDQQAADPRSPRHYFASEATQEDIAAIESPELPIASDADDLNHLLND